MALAGTKGYSQVYDGLYRTLTSPHTARMAAMGNMTLPMHDGDLQTVLFNPSSICPSMNNQISLSYVGDFKLGTNYAMAQYSHTFNGVSSFAATVQYNNYGEMASVPLYESAIMLQMVVLSSRPTMQSLLVGAGN